MASTTTTGTVVVTKGAIGDPEDLSSGIQWYANINNRKTVWFQSCEDRDRFIVRLATRLAVEGKDLVIA